MSTFTIAPTFFAALEPLEEGEYLCDIIEASFDDKGVFKMTLETPNPDPQAEDGSTKRFTDRLDFSNTNPKAQAAIGIKFRQLIEAMLGASAVRDLTAKNFFPTMKSLLKACASTKDQDYASVWVKTKNVKAKNGQTFTNVDRFEAK